MANSDATKQRPRRPSSGGSKDSRQHNRGRGRPYRGRGSGSRTRRAPITAILSLDSGASRDWANRIEAHLKLKHKSIFTLTVSPEGSLTDVIKEARKRGAHRIMAVGDNHLVDWAAQAMLGALMPLAPALIPGSKPIYGHQPLSRTGWARQVEALLFGRFVKADMAVGGARPFFHQLVAGFPVRRTGSSWKLADAVAGNDLVEVSFEIDRAIVSGKYWCVVVANADLPDGRMKWLPGADWTDQRLDLLLVEPRSFFERLKFLRAARKGLHGALPGVIRFRGHRITIQADKPFRYMIDDEEVRQADEPLVLEAKPEKLRVVVSGESPPAR